MLKGGEARTQWVLKTFPGCKAQGLALPSPSDVLGATLTLRAWRKETPAPRLEGDAPALLTCRSGREGWSLPLSLRPLPLRGPRH